MTPVYTDEEVAELDRLYQIYNTAADGVEKQAAGQAIIDFRIACAMPRMLESE